MFLFRIVERLSVFKRNSSFRPVIKFNRCFSDISPTEFKIDVPWGHIAGRHWNAGPSKKPILCIHGWKDNSATFDKLMPLIIPNLKNKYQFICIDLPGHGLSSHYPIGFIYQLSDSILWILRVMRHFGWSNFTIMGHSLGAIIGFIFSSTHTHCIDNLIAIDALTPAVFSHNDMLRMVSDITEHIFAMEEKLSKEKPPTYSKKEALKLMLESHMSGMSEVACKTLMTRGLAKQEEDSDRYIFAHDIRVQYLPISPISHRQISYLAKNFQSGLLHIKACKGVGYESSFLKANIKDWIDLRNEKSVRFVKIENASHHVHLTDPHLITDHIVDFLMQDK